MSLHHRCLGALLHLVTIEWDPLSSIHRGHAIKEINAFTGCLLIEPLWKSLAVGRSRDKSKVGLIALYKEKSSFTIATQAAYAILSLQSCNGKRAGIIKSCNN